MANSCPYSLQLQVYPYKDVLSNLKLDISSPDQIILLLIFAVRLILRLFFSLGRSLSYAYKLCPTHLCHKHIYPSFTRGLLSFHTCPGHERIRSITTHEAGSIPADVPTGHQIPVPPTQYYIDAASTGCGADQGLTRFKEDHQGSAAAPETNSTNRISSNDERWNYMLVTKLPEADYEVQEVDIDEENNSEDNFYSYQMWEGYRVKHEPRSHFIWQHSTDTLFALAVDGSVYGFSIDFECGYLISDTIEGAMSYITNPGTRAKGPARPPWGPYDINAEDMFGEKFGDEDYDSGIDDCDSESECD
ncbi:uncharacterized protein LAJ45_07285 [Morchella importuna]|uniref:uncharacterized protein n=1 Tax=Morchella importuna TaxID=1174673 RepID=UPI001E8E765F|nr:uncharacterized protein LAJ45_07285 [Morchella importuna]KAH8148574.1 hypothetical protein LAJ45_07285 [Morchella importuna]